MAQAQMNRSGVQVPWDYPNGLFVESILKVYDMYGGAAFYDYVSNYAKATIDAKTGKISLKYDYNKFTLDNLNPAMLILEVYKKEGLPQYKIALDTLRKQLEQQPRNLQGGYWHKKVYPDQMWLDGLYMGARYCAAYEKEYGNGGTHFDDIVNQFKLIHSKTYDPEYQLNYHAWSANPKEPGSFWARQTEPFKGCSPEFWSRGIGWYAASLVEVLEVMPNDYAKKKDLIDILNQVLAGIKRWQDPKSGCWYQLTRYDSTQVVDGKANFLEASASSMFVYAILKSIRLGFVPKDEYEAVGIKAYKGIIKNFVSEDSLGVVSLNRICKSAGLGPASDKTRDGSIRYYLTGSDAGDIVSNDLKGVGPFILASLEYERLQSEATYQGNKVSKEIHKNSKSKK
jgi:unsaturated rhamnogalacturonyl hydrolase